ncbi:trigger factor [Propionibacterium freudenreichii]|uniref:trigger factor n=1 Tax=Propionibacterium freudenreichii TaxID=1744 RepID=UPI00254A7744|nr:trigger factor [Propionibacterium freudenreichii]MDK9300798.1 trigger factor [Propionibacterium freudenreichii]MDK9320915.1 trigger factor [Propionibacterium freudenreichii]MDK9322896.1 trigger factor [Propionibacterium freudenreichii]MDK9338936.1 trigger factor [Propionibacterium freudenreichii]MDK9647720.1 trigger factor [Propionibacterium freudenreichii]
MPSTVEKLNPTRVKLTIEMPFAELQPKIDAAYKQISEQVNLPGFRRGKVPARLIDQRFGRGAVLQQAINDAIPDAYSKAVQDNELFPLGQPDIEVSKLEDGDVVELSAEVDVRPDFDIPDFSGIKVEVEPAKVSDEDVNERVELLRERFANLKEVDRAAKDGDVVNFDLSATQDGEPAPDAESNGMQYRVGAGGMVDGLDEALVGMKAGDEKSFSSKLVGGSHGGQDVDIKVTVNKVNEQELPALDDDFAQLVSEFDTVDEMLADLRDNLERMARIGQANEARDKIVEQVVEKVPFELPPAVLEADVKGYHDQIENQLNQSGLTLEQYLEEAEDEKADTPEEFWAEIDKRAEQGLRAQIVLDKLAEEQNVGVSQEEFTQLILQKAQQNGTTPEQELQHMSEHNHMPEWMGEVRRGKALNTIVDEAVVTDTDGNAVDLKHLQADGTIAEPAADEKAEDADKAEDAKADKPAKKPAAKKPAAKATKAAASKAAPKADKKPAAKKPAAKKPAAKKPAAKKADEAPADDAK